jgi:hypothetical protein
MPSTGGPPASSAYSTPATISRPVPRIAETMRAASRVQGAREFGQIVRPHREFVLAADLLIQPRVQQRGISGARVISSGRRLRNSPASRCGL